MANTREITPFPKDDINTKEKGKAWVLQAARAIWAEYQYSALYNYQQRIPTFRKYAKAQQPASIYVEKMGQKADASLLNLNWEPLKLAPKYLDLAKAMLDKYRMKPSAVAVDPLSVDARSQMKYYLYAMNFLGQQMGESPLLQQMMTSIPRGTAEVDRYMSQDYKQAIEYSMEAGIEMVLQRNSWDMLSDKIKDDLLTAGIAGLKVSVDSTGMVRQRDCDPQFMVLPPAKNPDMSDARYIGEVCYFTIAQLRTMDVNSDLSEGDWIDIANKYAMGGDNLHSNSFQYNNANNYEYDVRRIPVLDFEYLSFDSLVHEKKENKYGGYTLNERGVSYKVPKNSKYKREKLSSRYKSYYKGLWVIGSEHIFNFGRCDYQVRGNKAEGKLGDARSSYNVYVMGLKQGSIIPTSHVERMIVHIDSVQLSWLRMENIKAKMRPKGVAFDIDQIAAVAAKLGLSPNDVKGVIEFFDATGNIPYSSMATAEMGEASGFYNQQKPMQELDNGLPSNYSQMVEDFLMGIKLMKEVVAIPDAVDASNVNPNNPVRTSQMAAQGAHNALGGVVRAFKSIFLGTSICTGKKLQQIVASGKKVSGYIKGLGDGNIMALQLSSEIGYAEFGMTLEDMPNEDEQEFLRQYILQAIGVRTANGKGGISVGTGLQALRMLKHNVKAAEQYVISEIKKQEETDRQQELENIMLNQQSQMESAQMAHQGRQQEFQAQHQGKAALADQANQHKLQQLMTKGELDYNKMRDETRMKGIKELFLSQQKA